MRPPVVASRKTTQQTTDRVLAFEFTMIPFSTPYYYLHKIHYRTFRIDDFGPLKRSPQDKAELAKLRERQLQQAERLERYRRQLTETAERFSKHETGAADSVRFARDELDRRAVVGKMRDAANQPPPHSSVAADALVGRDHPT